MHEMSLVSRPIFSSNILHKATTGHIWHSSDHPATLLALFGIKWYLILSKPKKHPTSRNFPTVSKMTQIVRRQVLVKESTRIILTNNKTAGVTNNRNKNAKAINLILGYDPRFLRPKGSGLEVPEHTSNKYKVYSGRHLQPSLRTVLAYCLL